MLLLGMLAVSFDITEVVDDVDGAGQQGEEAKACNGMQHGRDIEQLAVKDDGREDEEALGPLLGAHGLD